MPKVVVLFDTRLAHHDGEVLATTVVPKNPGDWLVTSNEYRPLGTIVNEVKDARDKLKGDCDLQILCHGLSQPRTCSDAGTTRVGGAGLQLGAEGLDQSNVGILQAWHKKFRRIAIYGCELAYSEAPGSPCTIAIEGKQLCRYMAKCTAAEVIAPTHQQRYLVYPATFTDVGHKKVGKGFQGQVDFGDWEGALLLFSPDGGERPFVP